MKSVARRDDALDRSCRGGDPSHAAPGGPLSESRLFIHGATLLKDDELKSTYAQIAQLARSGATVTVFLVEEGVQTARRGPGSEAIVRALAAGAQILVDRQSLRSRSIDASALVVGARPIALRALVDRIAAGETARWL
jgi:sulfur relay (sulfurtransferase) DsrF/TusC family protein